MSAANAYRASIYGGLNLPRTNILGESAEVTGHAGNNTARRAFCPIIYEEYKAYCDAERNSVVGVSDLKYDARSSQAAGRPSFGRRLRLMATFFPWKDVNYDITLASTVAIICFILNGFFEILPVIAPQTDFEGESDLAVPATSVIGGIIYILVGFFALPAIWNDKNGILELSSSRTEDDYGDAFKVYQPVMIGCPTWRWWPSWSDLKALFPTVPFQAALLQSFGGFLLFGVGAIAFFQGVDDSTVQSPATSAPGLAGSIMMLISSFMLLVILQEKWYWPRLGNSVWNAALLNLFGAIFFMLSSIATVVQQPFTSTVASFIGSWWFLIGTLLQWYDLIGSYQV